MAHFRSSAGLILLIVLLFLNQSAANSNKCSSCTDLTLVPESNGSFVVLACVRLVEKSNIFPDDHQTLRRIAHIETTDGTQQTTYRAGFDGGIWSINQSAFQHTLNYNASRINAIHSYFGINWSSLKWSDLRIPLYSALAARIYIDQISDGQDLSQIDTQASIWLSAYNSSGEHQLNVYNETVHDLSDYRDGT